MVAGGGDWTSPGLATVPDDAAPRRVALPQPHGFYLTFPRASHGAASSRRPCAPERNAWLEGLLLSCAVVRVLPHVANDVTSSKSIILRIHAVDCRCSMACEGLCLPHAVRSV